MLNTMYCRHFNLSENPFSITPDPRFLFMSEQHRDALAHLLYGMSEGGGGFVQLTGEIGAGKTTLCRSILAQAPDTVDAALIFNPNQTAVELVASICDELRIDYPRDCTSLKTLTDLLNRRLLEAHANGRRTVLIVDEAQNLPPGTLEQLRLLTNLETDTRKLLQILLIGQPELADLTKRRDLRQLSQRITARYHLGPLKKYETEAYLRHRLEVAGTREKIFTRKAISLIHRISGGIPRIINVVADRALLGAYALELSQVGSATVKKAAAEVMGQHVNFHGKKLLPFMAGALVLAMAAGAPWFASRMLDDEKNQTVESPLSEPIPQAEADGRLASEPLRQAFEQSEQGEKTEKASMFELLAADDIPDSLPPALKDLLKIHSPESKNLPNELTCSAIEQMGLRCFVDRGTITKLRRINRPAALILTGYDRMQRFATATRVGEQSVFILVNGKEREVNHADLTPYWLGRFVVIWAPPWNDSTIIGSGSSGPLVRILRALLDRVDGAQTSREDNAEKFDPELKQRIINFQKSRGLEADGIVGEKTLFHLVLMVEDLLEEELQNDQGSGNRITGE